MNEGGVRLGFVTVPTKVAPAVYAALGALALAAVYGLTKIDWPRAIPWFNANEGLAGWVQAFGSVFAILAVAAVASVEGRRASRALAAAQRQQREALEEAERRALAKRASSRAYAREMAHAAVERCELLFTTSIKGHEHTFKAVNRVWGRDLEFFKQQLAEVPKFLVEDAALIKPVMRLALLVADILDGLADLEAFSQNAADMPAEREACRGTVKNMETRLGTMRQFLVQVDNLSHPEVHAAPVSKSDSEKG